MSGGRRPRKPTSDGGGRRQMAGVGGGCSSPRSLDAGTEQLGPTGFPSVSAAALQARVLQGPGPGSHWPFWPHKAKTVTLWMASPSPRTCLQPGDRGLPAE